MVAMLKGMRVVEGSAFVAVPLAGMTLAQMGAEVIRFDRIEGGLDSTRWPIAKNGYSLFWAGMNKGKKSVAVNMRSPEGKDLITHLITAPGDDAGIFLTNLRVRGWMDYETLSQYRKDLIMVTLMGDRHGNPAVDYTVNPALGFPEITGPEGHDAPVAHALPAWDCIAGNMAVSALLAAERHRLRTGQGQDVEFSLKDAAAAMLGHLGILADVTLNGADRQKSGNALYGAYGQDFVTADGQRIMVIGLTDRQWRGIVKTTETGDAMAELEREIGKPLSDEGVRWEHRHAITDRLKPWIETRDFSTVSAAFDGAGLTWAPFRSFAQAMAQDPDVSEANPMFKEMTHPGLGTFLTPGSPISSSIHARDLPGLAPELGQHTEEVLEGVLGLQGKALGRLFDDGIVASPTFNRQAVA